MGTKKNPKNFTYHTDYLESKQLNPKQKLENELSLDLSDALKRLRSAKRISISGSAKKAGMSIKRMQEIIESGDLDSTIKEIASVAYAFNFDMDIVFTCKVRHVRQKSGDIPWGRFGDHSSGKGKKNE